MTHSWELDRSCMLSLTGARALSVRTLTRASSVASVSMCLSACADIAEKGKDVTPGIFRAAAAYGYDQRFLDVVAFDVTHGPWRRGGFLDAIVTDPPYGVRAGAKRLGKSTTRKRNTLRDEPYQFDDGTFAHERPGYLPPSKPYELVDLTLDLVQLSRYLLVPGGRLVFFLPTVNDDFEHVDVPVVEGMREVKHEDGSLQDFGKWGRRVSTSCEAYVQQADTSAAYHHGEDGHR